MIADSVAVFYPPVRRDVLYIEIYNFRDSHSRDETVMMQGKISGLVSNSFWHATRTFLVSCRKVKDPLCTAASDASLYACCPLGLSAAWKQEVGKVVDVHGIDRTLLTRRTC